MRHMEKNNENVFRIGINASFARKPGTGIGQVTVNFLKKLTEFPTSHSQFPDNKKVEFVLYLEEDADFVLPSNFKKMVFLPLWKRDDLIRKIWWEAFSLPRLAKKDGCDALLSLYQCPTVSFSGMPHLMVVHDIIPRLFPAYLGNWRKKLYWLLTERAIKKASRLVAVSRRSEKDIIRTLAVASAKIAVSYVAADEIFGKEVSDKEKEQVLAKYGLKEGYIYHGGGLEVRKNAEGVLRAYKILLEDKGKLSDVPDLVVSGKLMPELAPLVTDVQELVQGLGIAQKVKLLGFVPQEDLPALYRAAGLFVYPSRYEGFGLPVLEAMHQGTPVITAKTSSLPEVGSDAVLYVDPEDMDEIAQVMRKVLNDSHLAGTLSLRGRQRAAKFTWDSFVSKITAIISAEAAKNKTARSL